MEAPITIEEATRRLAALAKCLPSDPALRDSLITLFATYFIAVANRGDDLYQALGRMDDLHLLMDMRSDWRDIDHMAEIDTKIMVAVYQIKHDVQHKELPS